MCVSISDTLNWKLQSSQISTNHAGCVTLVVPLLKWRSSMWSIISSSSADSSVLFCHFPNIVYYNSTAGVRLYFAHWLGSYLWRCFSFLYGCVTIQLVCITWKGVGAKPPLPPHGSASGLAPAKTFFFVCRLVFSGLELKDFKLRFLKLRFDSWYGNQSWDLVLHFETSTETITITLATKYNMVFSQSET